MVKLTRPLLGTKASGSLAGTVTLSTYRTRTIARRLPIPTDPKTVPQLYHRWLYQDYCNFWQTLTPAQKAQWTTNARRYKITGFNLFIRTYLTPPSDLAAFWHCDEGQGDTLTDFSGNGNHGTLAPASWSDGVFLYALSFDGVNERVAVAHSLSLNLTQAITIEAWFNTLDLANLRNMIVGKGETYRFDLSNLDHKLRFLLWLPGETPCMGNTILSENTWYHGAATYDRVKMRVYLNGQLDGENPQTAVISQNAQTLWISQLDIDAFKGRLDEIRIYNRALAQPEIMAHYLRFAS